MAQSAKTNGKLPLEGIRVLDLTAFVAGPVTTTNLAYYGAEVIKVEGVLRPDGFRAYVPIQGVKEWWESSSLWNLDNLNKLGITLDLTRPEGRDVFLRLVPMADIVIENFSPRVMQNFGLSYDVLKQANPSIIVVAMPAFGLSGPWRDYVGFATPLEHISGVCTLTGYSGEPEPYNPAGVSDVFGSMTTLVALFAALEHRRRTGEGQLIEVALIEAFMAATIPFDVIDYSLNKRMRQPQGNRHPFLAPHGVYPCAGDDSWIAITVCSDEDWTSFCETIGNPSWCRDEKFATSVGRHNNADELDSLVGDWTRQHDATEAMELLQAHGVAAGVVVQDPRDDPHLNARNFLVEIDRPIVGKRRYTNWPIRLSKTPGKHWKPAPFIGEDTKKILGGLLGLSDQELADLEEKKIIGTVLGV